mgnify:CR=1 FL=1
MAQDWMGLMKKVPWKTVAEAAPAIADAARRLGKRIDAVREGAEAGPKADPPTPPASAAPQAAEAATPGPSDEHRQALLEAQGAIVALQARVDGLQSRQAELAANLEQATRLVAELGEQNGRMAQAQEAIARRLGQAVSVAWGGVVVALVAAAVAVVAVLQ